MSSFDATPAQQEALDAPGPAIVAAAAGSGKTSVLTRRIFESLTVRNVPPERIVAVTFTRDAAQEIRSRVQRQLAAAGHRDLLERVELAAIGTIHGLCGRILRDHGTSVGIDPGFAILDEAQARQLFATAVRDVLARLEDDHEVIRLRVRIGDGAVTTFVRTARAQAATRRDGLLRVPDDDDLVAASGELPLEPAVVSASQVLGRVIEAVDLRYRALCRDAGGVDYEDLQRLALTALEIDHVRTAVRARWTEVLVDEFQDTDEVQEALLRAVGGDRMFMVGDEWQSIYGFRGADVRVFRSVSERADVQLVQMRDNFRSDAAVLDVVNEVFAHESVFGDRYVAVEPGAVDRPSLPAGCHGPSVTVLESPARKRPWPGEPDDADLAWSGHSRPEALVVAACVADLIRGGAAPGDIALLARARTHMQAFALALGEWGIPVLVGNSDSIFDHPAVADVLALLRWVNDRTDDAAAMQVLASPYARCSLGLMVELRRFAGRRVPLWSAIEDHPDPALRRVTTLIRELRRRARDASLGEVVEAAIDDPQFLASVLAHPDGRMRIANLRRLVELAGSAHGIGVTDLAGFLSFVETQRDGGGVTEATLADEHTGAVRIMTIHKSKGLEFPYVFLLDVGSGRPSSSATPLLDDEGTLVAPLWLEDEHAHRHGARGAALVDRGVEADLEEAQRLIYVALTRAKHRLWISYTQPHQKKDGMPSKSETGQLAWLLPPLGIELYATRDGWFHDSLDIRFEQAGRPSAARRLDVPSIAGSSSVVTMPTPLELELDTDSRGSAAIVDEPDRAALIAALRAVIAEPEDDADDARRIGIILHAALAALVVGDDTHEDVVAAREAGHGALLDGVVASDVFRAVLVAAPRAELPWVGRAADGERAIDGRMDVLATAADGAPWVVDWKTTLAPLHPVAWDHHGEQLLGYARAAMSASSADHAWVTLVPISEPDAPLMWRIDDGVERPVVVGTLPARA